MDRDTRHRALNYAAKTVMSAAFLAACGGSNNDSQTSSDVAPASDDEVISAESACKEGLAKLKEVFPSGDPHWFSHGGPDATLSADKDVTTCCESMLKAPAPPPAASSGKAGDAGPAAGNDSLSRLAKFRQAGCCAAKYPATSNGESAIGMACTPWGPPVPPSMAWKNRAIA
jgi:hypothetical protein